MLEKELSRHPSPGSLAYSILPGGQCETPALNDLGLDVSPRETCSKKKKGPSEEGKKSVNDTVEETQNLCSRPIVKKGREKIMEPQKIREIKLVRCLLGDFQ